ncbi:response regulator [bacterium]|nr:response regulator [bacterium]
MADHQNQPSSDKGAVKRALVADDEPTLVRFTEILLKREGFEVRSVLDGKDVLPVATEFHPDLLVLDLLMPNLNGFEVLRQLRSKSQLAGLKVLVCSGLNERDYILRAFEEGADDFIPKPFEPEDFVLRALKLTQQVSENHTQGSMAGDDVSTWIRRVNFTWNKLALKLEMRALQGEDRASVHDAMDGLKSHLDTLADIFANDEVGEEELCAELDKLRQLMDTLK